MNYAISRKDSKMKIEKEIGIGKKITLAGILQNAEINNLFTYSEAC